MDSLPSDAEQRIRELERRNPRLKALEDRLQRAEELLKTWNPVRDLRPTCPGTVGVGVYDRCNFAPPTPLKHFSILVTQLTSGTVLLDDPDTDPADPDHVPDSFMLNERTLMRFESAPIALSDKDGWESYEDVFEFNCPTTYLPVHLLSHDPDRRRRYGVFNYLDLSPVGGVPVEIHVTTSRNEVRDLCFYGGPTGGYVNLYGGGGPTPVAWNATAAAVKTALQAVFSLTSADLFVTGGPMNVAPCRVIFTGAAAGISIGDGVIDPAELPCPFLAAEGVPWAVFRRVVEGCGPMSWSGSTGGDGWFAIDTNLAIPDPVYPSIYYNATLDVDLPGTPDGEDCPGYHGPTRVIEYCGGDSAWYICRGTVRISISGGEPGPVGFTTPIPSNVSLGSQPGTMMGGTSVREICWTLGTTTAGSQSLPPASAFPFTGRVYANTLGPSTCPEFSWTCGEEVDVAIDSMPLEVGNWVRGGGGAVPAPGVPGIMSAAPAPGYTVYTPCVPDCATTPLDPVLWLYLPKTLHVSATYCGGLSVTATCRATYRGPFDPDPFQGWESDEIGGDGALLPGYYGPDGTLYGYPCTRRKVRVTISPWVYDAAGTLLWASTCWVRVLRYWASTPTPPGVPIPAHFDDCSTEFCFYSPTGVGVGGFVGPCDGNVDASFAPAPYQYCGLTGTVTN
jgi:hypothetical protein